MDPPTGERPAAGPEQAPEPAAAAPAERPQRSSLVYETCYRHRDVVTGVHCTRCERPICPDCMNPAPVGYQCPECVAEARRTGGRRRTITPRAVGSVTTALLVANIAVFALGMIGPGASMTRGPSLFVLSRFAMSPVEVAQGEWWRLFTSMFLHAGIIHIAFNMWALYVFGHVVESAFGKLRFTLIYFLAGFLASVTSYLFSSPFSVSVGASGAIFGLLGAWVAFNYRRRHLAFASAQLRSALMLVAINLFLGFTIPNIDNSAHIGGLIAGIAAGAAAEAMGARGTRQVLGVAGVVVLVLLGIGLTMYRTAVILGSF